jgi:sugar O-acyltransferase (sialic acid O-acetyltransferase NeuD family)
MTSPILIVGAGGHAAVVADALLAGGERLLGFTDVDSARLGRVLCGLPVLGDDRVLEAHDPGALRLANGIGGVRSTERRRTLQLRLQSAGWKFVRVRHPAAVVSPHAMLAEGTQLLAASVVQAGARVAEGCIVNTTAVIEHDAVLEAWVHVAPGALVCGDVKIGARSHVGAGAVIRQGIVVGPDTVVGAGAVVVEDFAGNGILAGVPARPLEGRA